MNNKDKTQNRGILAHFPCNKVKEEAKSIDKNNEWLHKKLCEELHTTFIKKNRDYGNSFEKSLIKRGLIAGLIRVEDKLSRLDSLLSGNKQLVNDESLMDTCLDAANYLIMMAMKLKQDTGQY